MARHDRAGTGFAASALGVALLMSSWVAGSIGTANAATKPVARAKYAVGLRHETLVDPSRPTPPNRTAPGQPDRRLPVAIWYPANGTPGSAVRADATPDRHHGSFPLVIFVHGPFQTPSLYADLLTRVAAAGYVVAAPTLPVSNRDAPGGPSIADIASNPADIRFVLSQLRAEATQPHDALQHVINPDRVAVAGHSMGGAVAYSVGFEQCCRDSRVLAVLNYSQIPMPLRPNDDAPQPFETNTATPVLFIYGDHDEFFRRDAFATAYSNASFPKYEITLVGASHIPPYQRLTDPHFGVVAVATIDFLDATIGRHAGPAQVASHLSQDLKSVANIATFAYATQPR